MKTLFSVLAITVALAAPARANDHQHLRTFATCAGRLSAVMEYQWMFDGPASERTKLQRAVVLDLIAAVIEPEQGRDVLHWRISAKQAQSALLTRATFNDEVDDAAWAQTQAARLTQDLQGCY